MTEITTAGYNAIKSYIRYDTMQIELATGKVEFIFKNKVVGKIKIADSLQTNETVVITDIRGKIDINGITA